jgi:NDP-sugar pyrophosphorylase family protein
MDAVILASGEGRRTRGWSSLPKPLLPFFDGTLLDLAVRQCLRAIDGMVFVTICHEAQRLRDYILSETPAQQRGVGITAQDAARVVLVQESRLTGPLGALLSALEHGAQAPCLVVSADAVHDVDLAKFLRFHEASGDALTFCVTSVEDCSAFGRLELDSESKVLGGIEKDRRLAGVSGDVSTGIYVSGDFDWRPPIGTDRSDFVSDLLPALLAQGASVSAFRHDRVWEDAGTREGYIRSHVKALQTPGILKDVAVLCSPASPHDANSYFVSAFAECATARLAGAFNVVGPGVSLKNISHLSECIFYSSPTDGYGPKVGVVSV